jgi:hypothetical protein
MLWFLPCSPHHARGEGAAKRAMFKDVNVTRGGGLDI